MVAEFLDFSENGIYIFSAILGGLISIAGLLLAAWYTNGSMLRLEKFRFLNEMKREIVSRDMMLSRTKTSHILATYRCHNLQELYKAKIIDDELHNVWVLIGFYERIYFAMIQGHIDRNIASNMFGELFLYFYFGCFRPQLSPTNWGHYSQRMDDMYALLKKNSVRKNFLKGSIYESLCRNFAIKQNYTWTEWEEQAKLDVEDQYQCTRAVELLPD